MSDWKYPKCHAEVDSGFDVCWQCGTSADGMEDAAFVPEVDVATLPEGFVQTIRCAACGYQGKIMVGRYHYHAWEYGMAGLLSLTMLGTALVFAYLRFMEPIRYKLCPKCRRGDAYSEWYGEINDENEDLWITAQAREDDEFDRNRLRMLCTILACLLVPGAIMLFAWLSE